MRKNTKPFAVFAQMSSADPSVYLDSTHVERAMADGRAYQLRGVGFEGRFVLVHHYERGSIPKMLTSDELSALERA